MPGPNTATYLERLLTFFQRAADVFYDPTESGLTATTVQAAIDEVAVGAGRTRPQSYGYTGTGDPTQATQAAIDAAIAGPRVVYFSAGEWDFPCVTSLDPGEGDLVFVGDGKGQTIFNIQEGTTGDELYLFQNTTTTRKGNLRFEGITFRGTLAEDPRDNFGNPLYLDFYSNVRLVDCEFDNIAGPAMDFHSLLSFRALGCDFTNIGRDGIRVRDSYDCAAIGCYFQRLGDDAIAFHTASYQVDADLAAGIPIRERLLVANCQFSNCGTVKMLGAKKTVIIGNTMHLMHLWAIQVASQATSEGTNPMHDVTITGNVITDVVGTTSPDAYMAIALLDVRGAAATDDSAPLRYDAVAAAVVRPWDWFQSAAGDTDYAWPPMTGLTITGNTCRRTLAAAAAFSDYGCGNRLDQGIATDPAVTDAKLLVGAAVRISGAAAISGLKVSGNTFEHGGTCLILDADAPDGLGIVNATFRDNTVRDFTGYGLLLSPAAAVYCDLTVEENTFDMDPYRRASNSNIDGTYDANGTPTGVEFGTTKGCIAKNNKFSNCCNMVNASTLADHIIEDNVAIMGTPASMTAFNTGNSGIGRPRADATAYRYVIADSDPTSATYLQVSSVMARSAASIPTSGWYYQGWFVWNTAPSTTGPLGWSRVTTGTGHVAGTDWIAVATP